MRRRDFHALFKTDHMLKDVLLCLAEAERTSVRFAAAEHARDLLARAAQEGYGDDDYASMIEALG
jgi:3-hydroxyisobutyrate dehydrogenase-like beta-hydroxyacid dehydrogenase